MSRTLRYTYSYFTFRILYGQDWDVQTAIMLPIPKLLSARRNILTLPQKFGNPPRGVTRECVNVVTPVPQSRRSAPNALVLPDDARVAV